MHVRKTSYKIGRIIILFFLAVMVLSFFYTPYPPNDGVSAERLQGPSAAHLLGTDNFGRDILSRIMTGSQTAFLMSFASVGLALMFGLIIGSISGYYGGVWDDMLMRVVDAMMSFPGILFAIMLVTVFGPGRRNTVIALAFMGVPYFSRVVRGGFLQIKKMDYVKAAIARGAGTLHIIRHHILPNISQQIIVSVTLSLSTVILSEAGLSYLGLGIVPPDPSWGRMLKEAQSFYQDAPWYILSTGITISLLVFGFTLVADGLRDLRVKYTGR